MTNDTGGPAFPHNFPPENPFGDAGMTLRDWFAGHAPEMPEWFTPQAFIGERPSGTIYPYEGPKIEFKEVLALDKAEAIRLQKWLVAADAYWRGFWVDAMIAERAKG